MIISQLKRRDYKEYIAKEPIDANLIFGDGAKDEPIKEDKKLPNITPVMLPDSISGWIADICERIETPFEVGAITALTLIGNLIGNRVSLRPKAKDSWTVVPNLWGMIVGSPSVKKTPVFGELRKAVSRLEKEASHAFKESLREFELENEVYKKRVLELKKANNSNGSVTLTAPARPTAKRYTTSDGTVEAIANIVQDNPSGLLVARDELSGFFETLSKQGREGDRAFYLEGWNGTGSFVTDRIMRGHTYIPKLTLGVFGNIQPAMIKRYVYEAVRGHKADGLLQRFQMTIFVEDVNLEMVDRYPDKELRDRYYEVVEKIATAKEFKGAMIDPFDDIPFYRFDSEAQLIFNRWYMENKSSANNAINEAHKEHLNKYPKLFASLCLIYHVCEVVTVGFKTDSQNVSKETVLKVLRLIEVLKGHAERLYSIDEVEEAKRDQVTDDILTFLSDKTLPISFREVTFKVRGKPNKATIKNAISGFYRDAGSKIISKLSR